MRHSDVARGVYYDPDAYVSLLRRLLIEAIDIATVVALTLIIVLSAAMYLLDLPDSAEEEPAFDRALSRTFILSFLSVSVLYFVVLKATRFRTLGYRLCGADLVTLKGTRPSILVHAYRFLFFVLGPLNIALDLLWLGGDTQRQALRDKFAKTYVIRRGATPTGSGPIAFVPYSFMGASFIFQEVAQEN